MLNIILTIPAVACVFLASGFFGLVDGTFGMFVWKGGIALSIISALLSPVLLYQLYLRIFKHKTFTNYQLTMLYVSIFPSILSFAVTVLTFSFGGM